MCALERESMAAEEEEEYYAAVMRTIRTKRLAEASVAVSAFIPYDEDWSDFDWNGEMGLAFRSAVVRLASLASEGAA